MFKKVLKNIYVRYAAALLVVSAFAYLVLSPLLIQHFFPQYDVVKKYVSVAVCTDLPPGTKSDVFLPINCQDVDKSRFLACISDSGSSYVAPAQATSDEKLACPTLTSGLDTSGNKNPALAVHPIDKRTLRIIIIVSIIATAITIYVLIWLIVRNTKRKKHDNMTHLSL